MLKVRNKDVVAEVAGTTYRASKKRNMLTVFAIVLTTFLIAVVVAIGAGYGNTIAERQLRMEGMDYDIELSEPKEAQVARIRSMDTVKAAGLAVKCAILETYNEKKLDKIRLYWLDETCWKKQTIPALESFTGRYPEKENEIMLSSGALKAMGITEPRTGMSLSVQYETLADDANGEAIEKEFRLSGWYRDYSGSDRGYVSEAFYRSSGVKQTDQTQGRLKISLNNPLYSEDDIIKLQKAVDLDEMQFIDADVDTISIFFKMILGIAAMLLMILASGYLFIYNTLYLSISRDIRYYGQLKTLGMTSVQLKRVVYRQALWNAVIGIPMGLAAAFTAAQIVVPEVLHIVNPVFSAEEISMAPIWVYAAAAAFAFITNWISSRKPARIAAECSPVEAMRYQMGTMPKHVRCSEGGGVLSMTGSNLFRDRKQTAIILLSFTLAVLMFMIINVVIGENDAKRILEASYSYDIRYKNETTLDEQRENLLTDDRITAVRQISGVGAVRKVTSTRAVVPYQEDVFGEYYRQLYESRFSPGNYEEDIAQHKENPDNSRFDTRLIGVDDAGFRLLNEQLGGILDRDQFENGEIAVAIKMFTEGDNGMTGKTVRFRLPDGMEPGREQTIKIAAVGEGSCNPAWFAGGYTPELIVSEQYAQTLLGEPFVELIQIVYEEAFSADTEQRVKQFLKGTQNLSCDSRLDRYEEMKNAEMQVTILGNSIGIMIAVLAVLNYFNMIAAGIQNRSMEFAVLESIGMTGRQIRQMLALEGAGYAFLSLAAAVCLGIPVSHMIFDSLNLYGVAYAFPWMRNLILFAFIVIVCMGTPVALYQKTQNASVIERLRRFDE